MSAISEISRPGNEDGGDHSESYPWVRYIDEQGLAYWYNYDTHESQWDEAPDITQGGDVALVRMEDGDRSTLIPKTKKKNEKRKTKKAKKQQRQYIRYFELDWSSMLYYSFLWLNIIVCETPAALLEGALRLALLAVALACTTAYYLILTRRASGNSATHSPVAKLSEIKDYIAIVVRDMLLTSAALLTLLIPGSLYLVYRDMTPHVAHTDPDGNIAHWTLSAIPTILGSVDPRRFAIITVFGAGANASNALSLEDSTEESKEADSRTNDLDGWQNSCVYLPRNVLYRFQSTE
ncbi:hypothetical protein EON65_41950 [archaeon]|nr:MAG: hypothetical protein EON65_41950 [archaeon]